MKRFIALLLMLIMVSSLLCACGKPRLNETEDRAATNVKKLIDLMKDPDSFILRGDVLVIRDEDTGNYYTFIDYSGNNSYGASVRSMAIYKNYSYLCDYDDEGETLEEKLEIANAKVALAGRNLVFVASGNEPEGSVLVSGEKIAKYLDIAYKD